MKEDNRLRQADSFRLGEPMLLRDTIPYGAVRSALIENPSEYIFGWANTVAHITDQRFGGIMGYLDSAIPQQELQEVRTLELYTLLISSSVEVMKNSSYIPDFPYRKRQEIAGRALSHAAYVGMLEGNGYLEGMPVWDDQITQLRSQEMQPILATLFVQDSWDLTADLLSETFRGLSDLDVQTAPYIGAWVFADVVSEVLRKSTPEETEAFIYSVGEIEPLQMPLKYTHILHDGFILLHERIKSVLESHDPQLKLKDEEKLKSALVALQSRIGIV